MDIREGGVAGVVAGEVHSVEVALENSAGDICLNACAHTPSRQTITNTCVDMSVFFTKLKVSYFNQKLR